MFAKYFFTIIISAILYFSIFDITVIKDDEFIQTQIDNVMPKKISKKGFDITINKLEINSKNSALSAKANLDIEHSFLNLKEKTANILVEHVFEKNKIILKIKDISFENLSLDEVKQEVIENTTPIIEHTKDKLIGFLNNKLGIKKENSENILKDLKTKVIKIKDERFNDEQIKIMSLELLRNNDVLKYDLGLYGLLVNDFKVNYLEDDRYNIEVSLSLGILGIIFSLTSLFLLWARELGILSINFYQKNLSHKKGYCCARNVVSEDGTCSSITKEAFVKDGFISGMKEYSKTTKKCKEDFKTYEKDKTKYDKKRNSNNNSDNCNVGDYMLAGCAVGSCPDVGSC